ncbi:hypothetical protein QP185_18865 [Sphingomonas aerolata]|uniref:hypothetical protein n=1 Tax=Sphingomonas aerolata TaxID=185951 RepID=UPI002FE0A500
MKRPSCAAIRIGVPSTVAAPTTMPSSNCAGRSKMPRCGLVSRRSGPTYSVKLPVSTSAAIRSRAPASYQL